MGDAVTLDPASAAGAAAAGGATRADSRTELSRAGEERQRAEAHISHGNRQNEPRAGTDEKESAAPARSALGRPPREEALERRFLLVGGCALLALALRGLEGVDDECHGELATGF